MIMRCFNLLYIILAMAILPHNSVAQGDIAVPAAYKTVIAGQTYQRGNFHQWLWGRNRRVEWTTPVQVPVLWLDTACGGLTPYKNGGGNETKSLRLRSSNGKEYALRSIDKSRDDVIPGEFKNTFIENIIRDGVSMSHPYGALALPVMQHHAGMNYTLPIVVYVPHQQALDTFGTRYENDLYLFEQRPDGDWSDAPNLGGYKEYLSTNEVVAKLLENNHHEADQRGYAKARLFDMLVADWDRHEDNWRWGVTTKGNKTIYIPIARDRDQAFYAHNGVLVDLLLPAAGLGFMQNFDHNFKDIRSLNTAAKDMDRFFTNSLSQQDWLEVATSLQQALTDTVIAQSVRQLPPEIFNVSGKDMIEKLKSRRDKLPSVARDYYRFLAMEVCVPGTGQREFFDVKRIDSDKTQVAVYRFNEQGQKETDPYYRRTFAKGETGEIRIFGENGQDEYNIEKQARSIKVSVYDTTPNFKYKWYKYNYKGFSPDVSYNNPDRLYVGIKYSTVKEKWDRNPPAHQYEAGVRYSISQNAITTYGKALYPSLVGNWDLSLMAEFDAIRWTNFYGTGNESVMVSDDVVFHRLRSREWFANVGLTRNLAKSRIMVSAFYQNVKNRNDTGRYVAKIYHMQSPSIYESNPYGGAQVSYSFTSLNDSIVPVKGLAFVTTGTLSNNFRQKEFFQKYEAHMRAFLPITKHISFALRAGGATVVNDAVLNSVQPYQHAIIGGGRSLRGYRRERFWGQTAYYNQNELRFITDFHTRILNGKIGVFGFFDNGRVWMPGENSNKIHTGYGPGFLLAPFNKISATITYSISEEARLIQVRIDSKF
jgi:hypothetical protein